MSFKDKIISFLMYDGLPKEDYNLIKDDIYERNRKFMIVISFVSVLMFAGLFVGSLSVSELMENRIIYLVMVVVSIGLTVIFHIPAKKNVKLGIAATYVYSYSILSVGIFIGTVTGPQSQATAFIVLLVLIPLLTYDIVIRSFIFRLIMVIIYVIVAPHFKSMDLLVVDLANIISFGLLGTVCVGFTQHFLAKAFFLQHNMEDEIKKQTAVIEERTQKIARISDQTVTAMAAAIDAKDPYTNGHSVRVATYSKMIAQKMGMNDFEQKKAYYVGLLHDVGKIGVPDGIIHKTESLSNDEYETVRNHPNIGYNILKEVDDVPDIAVGARFHHEKFDGTGYPLHLKGEEIPLVARIVAVADSYDAMTSNRSYRSVMPQDTVRAEIQKGRGTQFDPKIADIMIEIIDGDKEYTLHG